MELSGFTVCRQSGPANCCMPHWLQLFLLRLGVLPLGEHAAALPHALLTAAFFIAFACYDILFSKIIALFRMLFRDRP